MDYEVTNPYNKAKQRHICPYSALLVSELLTLKIIAAIWGGTFVLFSWPQIQMVQSETLDWNSAEDK